jgi:DHA1 family inner membrane transport protein
MVAHSVILIAKPPIAMASKMGPGYEAGPSHVRGAVFRGSTAVVTASMVPDVRRVMAVSGVMLGLTAPTVIGIPAANLMGQFAG